MTICKLPVVCHDEPNERNYLSAASFITYLGCGVTLLALGTFRLADHNPNSRHANVYLGAGLVGGAVVLLVAAACIVALFAREWFPSRRNQFIQLS